MDRNVGGAEKLPIPTEGSESRLCVSAGWSEENEAQLFGGPPVPPVRPVPPPLPAFPDKPRIRVASSVVEQNAGIALAIQCPVPPPIPALPTRRPSDDAESVGKPVQHLLNADDAPAHPVSPAVPRYAWVDAQPPPDSPAPPLPVLSPSRWTITGMAVVGKRSGKHGDSCPDISDIGFAIPVSSEHLEEPGCAKDLGSAEVLNPSPHVESLSETSETLPADAAFCEDVNVACTIRTPSSSSSGASDHNTLSFGDLFAERITLIPVDIGSDFQRRAFVMAPLSRTGGSLKAKVVRRRQRGFFKRHIYDLFVQSSNLLFLASACNACGSLGAKPYYVISSSEHEAQYDSGSPHFLASVSGNLLRTRYSVKRLGSHIGENVLMRRAGLAMNRPAGVDHLLELRMRKETDAPRTVEVSLPLPDAERDIQGHLSKAASISLASPEAEYNEASNEYSLDFHGRVLEAAACNFQLAVVENGFQPGPKAPLCMQFGKVQCDTYHLDVCYPLSPLQAFAIALTSFDSRPAETLRFYY